MLKDMGEEKRREKKRREISTSARGDPNCQIQTAADPKMSNHANIWRKKTQKSVDIRVRKEKREEKGKRNNLSILVHRPNSVGTVPLKFVRMTKLKKINK